MQEVLHLNNNEPNLIFGEKDEFHKIPAIHKYNMEGYGKLIEEMGSNFVPEEIESKTLAIDRRRRNIVEETIREFNMTNPLEDKSQSFTSDTLGIAPTPVPHQDLLKSAKITVDSGKEYLFSLQRKDFHWCAELESNPTITAEYVFLYQMIERDIGKNKEKVIRYFTRQQNEDGSFGIAKNWKGDISTTAEVYLALRILGFEPEDPLMRRAEDYILKNGGLEKIRIFTRISFAMFGLLPWTAIPAIPPETILLPPQLPINVYSLSSWARGTMIPLFIIFHHQPIFALPNGRTSTNHWLDHLWLNPENKNIPYSAPWSQLLMKEGLGWRSIFGLSDALMKGYEQLRINVIRRKSLDLCVQWILERQEETGDWGGIIPPVINGIIALSLEGYGLESAPISKGIQAIESFSWEDADGLRIQACVSPVWDTALSTISLLDAGEDPVTEQLQGAVNWLYGKQLLVEHGDWKVYRPKLLSGGWSFEYYNSWYPDVDDTAAVLLALLKQNPHAAYEERTLRAINWVLGMQNKDGGWAAFDVNNDKLFLNSIPFADLDALCDPSTPDVTGRVIESLGMLLEVASPFPPEHKSPSRNENLYYKIRSAIQEGTEYLRKTQEKEGCWFGRWGVNYIYGTSNVLCGLSRVKVSAMDPMIKPALTWLKQCQNKDGGWGESIESYEDRKWMGKGRSTPSQTAWALMALLSYLPAIDSSIQSGIQWLILNQYPASPVEAYEGGLPVPEAKGSTWEEIDATGTGFPKHFYMRYRLYRHYFPMMALGRFIRAHQCN